MRKSSEKSVNVSTSVMERLVALKKANGFKNLSQVVSYLLDLLEPAGEAQVSAHVQRQIEYQRVLETCQKIRELLEQPVQVAIKPVELVEPFPDMRPIFQRIDNYHRRHGYEQK